MLSVNYWETFRTTEAANGDLARALEEYMLRNIQGVDVLLTTTIDNLARNPSLLTPGNTALIDQLKQRVAPYPVANAIVVLDAEGNLVGDSLGNGGPGRERNFADRPYYQMQRDDPGRGLFIDVPVASRMRKTLVIAVSRAYLTPDGRFGGVVFVPLDYENLRQFFLSMNALSRRRHDSAPSAERGRFGRPQRPIQQAVLAPSSAGVERKLRRKRDDGRDVAQHQLSTGRRPATGGLRRTRPDRVPRRLEEQRAVLQRDRRGAQSADRRFRPRSGATMAAARAIRTGAARQSRAA
jgi:hypothetical protein